MTIQQIQFQHRALQRYKRRIEQIKLGLTDAVNAAIVADVLERQITAQWGVLFSAFLNRVKD
jgi:hypothetical protein